MTMERPARRPRPTRCSGLFAGAFLLLGLAVEIRAAACTPGAFDLFDFQVGDVFQYQVTTPLPDQAASAGRVVTTRKYRIASRTASGPIRLYRIEGRYRQVVTRTGETPADPTFGGIEEEMSVVDTVKNPFAGCDKEIVPMPPSFGYRSTFWTRVQAWVGDTSVFALAGSGLRMKTYGRELGMWVGGDAISPIMDTWQSQAYGEGLGLLRASIGGMNAGDAYTQTLVGYSKGGVTVGVLSPDSAFYGTTAIRPRAESSRIGTPSASTSAMEQAFDPAGRSLPRGRRAAVRFEVR
jgi:hypothetical protein